MMDWPTDIPRWEPDPERVPDDDALDVEQDSTPVATTAAPDCSPEAARCYAIERQRQHDEQHAKAIEFPGKSTSGGDNAATSDARPPAKRWHRMPELVDVIMSRTSEPWARFTVGEEELVRVRAGGNVVLMGRPAAVRAA